MVKLTKIAAFTISGSIPGFNGSVVTVRKSLRNNKRKGEK